MKSIASIGAALAAVMLLFAQPALAKCGDNGVCAMHKPGTGHQFQAKRHAAQAFKVKRIAQKKSRVLRIASKASAFRTAAKHRNGVRYAGKIRITPASFTFHIRAPRTSHGFVLPRHFEADAVRPSPNQGAVVSMIGSMAPRYGVPTWFALRIAKVESNFNPALRGSAGEYGVFQIKCQTARGLGFSGSCSQLSDARTNVRWGLAHLAAAMELSGGNLQLAASKHNGGLGQKSIIRGYVARVF